MSLGGITGEFIYKGDLGTFMPILHLGREINAGKNTGFGMGKMEIEFF
ncbi:MAG: CRISPR system precrRNA processing endoribonuclease RAMP protein Cas6 [bacterium]